MAINEQFVQHASLFKKIINTRETPRYTREQAIIQKQKDLLSKQKEYTIKKN